MSKKVDCPRAKSDMTPCYLRDGDVVIVKVFDRDSCVGCEWSIAKIKERENGETKRDN